jgi:hypothetical protein
MTIPKNAVKLAMLAVALLAYFIFESRVPVTRPLVYLVPAEFTGPVFVFFGQKDGITTTSDPLGQAVAIPPNGILKLRADVDELVGSPDQIGGNVKWISLAPNGNRQQIPFHHNTYEDTSGRRVNAYSDASGRLHEHHVAKSGDPFYYLTKEQKAQKMIFAHDSCKHQKFVPEGSDLEPPDCAKFMVLSPAVFLKVPNSMWDDLGGSYTSVEELEASATARIEILRRLSSTLAITADQ